VSADAIDDAPAASPLAPGLVAVATDRLDRVRGGFETASGLQIAFGIERAVYVNGNLVSTTSLNVSDQGKVTTGAGTQIAPGAATSLATIQIGAGNSVAAGALGSAAALGSVVQNTLNGQAIQSLTVINAATNSLQSVRASSLQSSLRGVLIDALRR